MTWVVGVDEAGYGPNLGPLVITATVWRLPRQPATVREHPARLLGDLLWAEAVDCSPAALRGADHSRLVVADSKVVYTRGGLGLLERGALAALAQTGPRPAHWNDIWRLVGGHNFDRDPSEPWFRAVDYRLPQVARDDEIDHDASRLRSALKGLGIELSHIASDVVSPRLFNELVQEHGNKATVLSRRSLALVRECLDRVFPEFALSETSSRATAADPAQVWVVCDKHGGRGSYGRLLQEIYPDILVQHRGEGRERSEYQLIGGGGSLEFLFSAKGEAYFPVALASMVSKYLRELAMRAFNDFWAARVPGIRPTAGYPQDAKRFREEIEGSWRELGVDEEVLWRAR